MEKVGDQIGCLRCGRCCWYITYNSNDEPYLKRCKHLVRFKDGKTLCRIYYKRKLLWTENGIKIDEYEIKGKRINVFCMWRENGQFNYAGCPFNVKGVMSFESYIEQKGLKIK